MELGFVYKPCIFYSLLNIYEFINYELTKVCKI